MPSLMQRALFAAALFGMAAAAGSAVAQAKGAELYSQNCAACHHAEGEGIPDIFPALAGSAIVQGDPKIPAGVVTHGRNGMPSFAQDLNDDQLAAILTYMRSSWGNKAGPVDPALVKDVRSQPAP